MVYEISVFLENKISHFEHITNILKEGKVNIRSMNLNNIENGWGILNLLVDQPEKAYTILNEKGNSVALREVIALEMKDQAGGLDELLLNIAKAGIHFKNAYSRLISEKQIAILILEVPDVIEAKEKLQKCGIPALNPELVYGR